MALATRRSRDNCRLKDLSNNATDSTAICFQFAYHDYAQMRHPLVHCGAHVSHRQSTQPWADAARADKTAIELDVKLVRGDLQSRN